MANTQPNQEQSNRYLLEKYLGQLQIDVRRIGTIPYYLRTPLRKNVHKQIDQSLCAIPKGSSRIRCHTETAKILEEKYNEYIKIYTDGSKKNEKVGSAVITSNEKLRKRLKPQKMVDSAEQEAIIKAIFVTQRTGEHNGLP
jgi:hypothetical protein